MQFGGTAEFGNETNYFLGCFSVLFNVVIFFFFCANSYLQTNSEIEELETWKDRLNSVVTNYDNLLMETVALIENDDE